MPKLRELFQQHRVEEIVSPSKFATWAYNLLEAIVEELEAQRPPQVDARIVALTADRDSWERQCRNAERGLAKAKFTIAENDSREQQCRNVERELAEAKAEIERLRKEYDAAKDEHEMYEKGARARAYSRRQECQDWRIQCEEADQELAEAKAEIERLQKNCDYLRQQMIQARVRRAEVCRQLTEARVELESYTESVNADAALGKMVREMRPGASLMRVGPLTATSFDWQGYLHWPHIHKEAHSPAEALRAIQKEPGE